MHYEAVEADELAPALEALRAPPDERSPSARARPREHVRERFAWDAIAARWHAHPALRELLEGAAVS